MKTKYYLLALICALIIIWLICQCGKQVYCALEPPCKEGTAAPSRIDTQLVLELKNLYTKDDIVGKPDSFAICALGRFSGKPISVEKDDCRFDCKVIDRIMPTGKAAFLEDLNGVLFYPDTKQYIDDFTIIDFCECDEEIILIQVSYPDSVDIYSGIAGSTSSTKEESNGSIGAIGYNYNLDDIAELNDAVLGAERGAPVAICGVVPIAQDFFEISDSPQRKDGSDDPDIAPSFLNVLSELDLELGELLLTFESDSCRPVMFNPRVGLANINDDEIIKVAIVDTGVDPYYNYRGTYIGNHSVSILNDAFTFTEEAAYYNQNMRPSLFPYGAQMPGSPTDENTNCLSDDYYGYDYKGNDNNPSDQKGHGTHIAHTVLTANKTGAKVRVMPLQFGDYEYSTSPADTVFKCDLFAAICAINYAVNHEADIINMSWGYFAPEVNQPLHNQINRANEAGILMVASAGNSDRSVDECLHWPSNYSTVDSIKANFISVAALDTFSDISGLQLADYSNYGNAVDIAAPGTDIASALLYSENGTVELSGTSMAAGVISRRASILMFQNKQRRTAAEVKRIILDEAIQRQNVCINQGRLYDFSKDSLLLEAIGYD